MCGGVVANDTISFRKLIFLLSWIGDIVVHSTMNQYECEPPIFRKEEVF
jgi:hypothetical protein